MRRTQKPGGPDFPAPLAFYFTFRGKSGSSMPNGGKASDPRKAESPWPPDGGARNEQDSGEYQAGSHQMAKSQRLTQKDAGHPKRV
ncbi:hypothetical protein [Paenibacillus rhizophilus]|uniref:Uncharacterized protein n=1 Tax=Paenibacillus rhizophilus TaxID=1850366 RepID=A0A3N9P265_9BACL|nr:hypothetical protein [Paenibacillus rhizophilus]RQW10293.1 hypothetical protein EH198_15795 [Paenibacillus rhizophilus]